MSKQRAKGTAFENLVADYLRETFPEVHREDFSSPLGDLRGTPATLECKDNQTITLPAYIAQVQKADLKTKREMPVVVVKRRRANVKDAYFVTDLEHGAQLLKALEICKREGWM